MNGTLCVNCNQKKHECKHWGYCCNWHQRKNNCGDCALTSANVGRCPLGLVDFRLMERMCNE